MKHYAFIGVGSNRGRKLENCRHALKFIACLPETELGKRSSLFQTEPWGTSQEWYINGVTAVFTDVEPGRLLARCHAIERRMGRRRTEHRWEDRVIDLDVLLFDDLVIDDAGLRIPHPELHKRRFVLEPMCEIAPELVHPVLGMSMAQLLARAEDERQVWPIREAPAHLWRVAE